MISGQESGANGHEEVELNLAPIIDCFVVLVTFLLISASYLSIGILETALATPGQEVQSPPEDALDIKILSDSKIEIEVVGKHRQKQVVEIDRMVASVQAIKKQLPKIDTATVIPTNDMSFGKVVTVMDQVKQEIPKVALGGKSE